jgi:hypothetical protein
MVKIIIKKGGKEGWVAERMDNNVIVGHCDDPETLYEALLEAVSCDKCEVIKDYESH